MLNTYIMKTHKIIYWISTGLLSAMMLMSAFMYFFNNAEVSAVFVALGFPTYIIYPLAIAKILGITAIITRKSFMLKEWAYAGFFFDFVLAFSAHYMVGDGEYIPSLAALVFLMVSYIYQRKVYHYDSK